MKYFMICSGKFLNSEFEQIDPTKQTELLHSINREIGCLTDYIEVAGFCHIEALEVIDNSIKYIVEFTSELTKKRHNTFVNEIKGQFGDGWGEGFEQYPFFTDHDTGEEFYFSPYDENSCTYTLTKIV